MSLFRFNPFSRSAPQEPAAGAVNVGDRFYKPGQRGSIWTVIRVFKPTSNSLTHVVLERGGENPETYVISLGALMNPHMFRRDKRDPESVNVEGRQRRWSDHIKEDAGVDSEGTVTATGPEDEAAPARETEAPETRSEDASAAGTPDEATTGRRQVS